LDFSGKVVIVTGGSRGVGRGIAKTFLDAGADVVICGRNEPESLPEGGGNTALFVAADVRDPDGIDAVVAATVERFGRLDVLVNNAGGGPPADSATASPKFSTAIITLNLIAPLVFAQRANAVMQQQDSGGVIINIASVSGIRPSPDSAAYGAAKAGLLNLTQTLAQGPRRRGHGGLRRDRAVTPLLRRPGRRRSRRPHHPGRAHGQAR
jgi:NAD(P)-dependent dehydrogenase (short-subunit alcohol dehydrogenase family)